MMKESVKSLEKSKNVLEEKRKIVKQKICIKKTHKFTIITMNFVQEQLKIVIIMSLLSNTRLKLSTSGGLESI